MRNQDTVVLPFRRRRKGRLNPGPWSPGTRGKAPRHRFQGGFNFVRAMCCSCASALVPRCCPWPRDALSKPNVYGCRQEARKVAKEEEAEEGEDEDEEEEGEDDDADADDADDANADDT